MMGDRLAIPYAISVDGLLEVISAWNRLPDSSDIASKEDVDDVCQLGAESIRKQNPFLEQLGFIEKEETAYRLTDVGSDLARLADYMRLDEFGLQFRGVVADWAQFIPVIEFVKNASAERDDIITRIVLHSGRAKDNKDTLSGAAALLDLMVTADIFQESDGKVTLSPSFQQQLDGNVEVRQFESTQMADSMEIRVRIDIQIERGTPTAVQSRIIEDLISSLRSIGFSEILTDE